MEQQKRERKGYTIDDVARELGVSKTTVSRAISGKGRIGAATRKRVLEFVREYHYRPHTMGEALPGEKKYNIGLILPGNYVADELPFFQRCMGGVCEVAASRGYEVVIVLVTERDISQLERVIAARKVDGFIFSQSVKDDPALERLRETGMPVVMVGSTDLPGVVQVDHANRDACRELTATLLAKGMRRIALVGRELEYWVNQRRLEGFVDACRQQGLTEEEYMVRMDLRTDLQIENAVEEALAAGAECILSSDEEVCRHVLGKLKRLRVSIPEQVRVASFYDSALLQQYTPSITSLQFNARELGRAACQRLMGELEGVPTEEEVPLGYQVALRESTQ